MNPSVATLVYALGILGLFYLNSDKSAHTSRALWIPVIWFWILGSRAVSAWLGGAHDATIDVMQMDGSPTDAVVYGVLLATGLAVLARRGHRSLALLKANWPIVLYFVFCLMSVVWSDFPDIAIKRWIKATGDVVMALVVVTDAQPVAALRRLFSRVGFVLIPSSVLLIKYYPDLGHAYNPWTGENYITGVTTHKNLLGVTTYILSLGAFWQVLRLWRESSLPARSRQLVAQCTILGLGVWTVFTANSATSESCLMVGAFLLLVTGSRRIRGRPAVLHALILTLILLGVLIKITGADAAVVHALGRQPDLTGRASEVWPVLIHLAPNALLGAGFEGFWLGPRLLEVWEKLTPGLHINEAHNGYLEVYLNLGAIGVALIFLILVHGYRRSVAACQFDPDSGSLMLAYVLTAVMYSYTEAGFRMLFYQWSFLILAIMGASRISKLTGENAQKDTTPSESVWWGTAVQTTSIPANH
jgi:exopolysaccharide production protein ExoQ